MDRIGHINHPRTSWFRVGHPFQVPSFCSARTFLAFAGDESRATRNDTSRRVGMDMRTWANMTGAAGTICKPQDAWPGSVLQRSLSWSTVAPRSGRCLSEEIPFPPQDVQATPPLRKSRLACSSVRRRHVQQIEATDGAFAAIAGIGVVTWGFAPSGGDCRRIQKQLMAL